MSGRGDSTRAWLRGALVVVAIAAVLGVFGAQTMLSRPSLSAVNLAGVAVMLCGLAVALLGPALAKRAAAKRDAVSLALRLCGVLVCGVGAILVFL